MGDEEAEKVGRRSLVVDGSREAVLQHCERIEEVLVELSRGEEVVHAGQGSLIQGDDLWEGLVVEEQDGVLEEEGRIEEEHLVEENIAELGEKGITMSKEEGKDGAVRFGVGRNLYYLRVRIPANGELSFVVKEGNRGVKVGEGRKGVEEVGEVKSLPEGGSVLQVEGEDLLVSGGV